MAHQGISSLIVKSNPHCMSNPHLYCLPHSVNANNSKCLNVGHFFPNFLCLWFLCSSILTPTKQGELQQVVLVFSVEHLDQHQVQVQTLDGQPGESA